MSINKFRPSWNCMLVHECNTRTLLPFITIIDKVSWRLIFGPNCRQCINAFLTVHKCISDRRRCILETLKFPPNQFRRTRTRWKIFVKVKVQGTQDAMNCGYVTWYDFFCSRMLCMLPIAKLKGLLLLKVIAVKFEWIAIFIRTAACSSFVPSSDRFKSTFTGQITWKY